MQKITILLLLIAMGMYASAQTLDTVFLASKAKKFNPGKHILISFEINDTVDATGKHINMSRSYYFDEKNRTLSSVREYYNPNKPKKGTQVIYTFGANKLASVTVVPPRSTCKNCSSLYMYVNDSLVSKQENKYTHVPTTAFVQQARYFRSNVPQELPWGFFNDEVMVNGKRKKLKKQY